MSKKKDWIDWGKVLRSQSGSSHPRILNLKIPPGTWIKTLIVNGYKPMLLELLSPHWAKMKKLEGFDGTLESVQCKSVNALLRGIGKASKDKDKAKRTFSLGFHETDDMPAQIDFSGPGAARRAMTQAAERGCDMSADIPRASVVSKESRVAAKKLYPESKEVVARDYGHEDPVPFVTGRGLFIGELATHGLSREQIMVLVEAKILNPTRLTRRRTFDRKDLNTVKNIVRRMKAGEDFEEIVKNMSKTEDDDETEDAQPDEVESAVVPANQARVSVAISRGSYKYTIQCSDLKPGVLKRATAYFDDVVGEEEFKDEARRRGFKLTKV